MGHTWDTQLAIFHYGLLLTMSLRLITMEPTKNIYQVRLAMAFPNVCAGSIVGIFGAM